MNLKELDFPIRAYWDLTPALPDLNIDYLGICSELEEIKVLNLSILDSSPSLSETCIKILKHLSSAHLFVSLAIPISALSRPAIDLLTGLGVKVIFIEMSSIDELRPSIAEIKKYESANLPAGIYFRVNRGNFRDIPDVLPLCIANSIGYLVLPMQRLMNNSDCFYIKGKEREELSLRLNKIEKPEGMRFIINDPFLWKAFYPEVQYPEGGCQAANSMVYISPEGDVYPCPAMPIRLGSLKETPLKEILLSPRKIELRKNIVKPANRCLDCDELKQCLGGCKGRAYVLTGSLDNPDPACK